MSGQVQGLRPFLAGSRSRTVVVLAEQFRLITAQPASARSAPRIFRRVGLAGETSSVDGGQRRRAWARRCCPQPTSAQLR